MRKWTVFLVSACLMSVFAGVTAAQDAGDLVGTREPRVGNATQHEQSGALLVSDVWVRPTAVRRADGTPTPGAEHHHTGMPGAVTAGYMTIRNTTEMDYVLTGVAAAFSPAAEIHETRLVEGFMQMRPMEDGLHIPAGARIELKPGSFHVMLMDVTEPLYQDSATSLTLTFWGEDGSTVEQTVGALVTDFPLELGLIIPVNAYAMTAPVDGGLLMPDATPTPAPETSDALALYVTLINAQAPTVNLVGARIDFAETVEVRESYLEEGRLTSRAIPFVPIPVQARLLLQPNGYFLRAASLSEMPAAGEAFLATLLLDDGTELVVPFLMR